MSSTIAQQAAAAGDSQTLPLLLKRLEAATAKLEELAMAQRMNQQSQAATGGHPQQAVHRHGGTAGIAVAAALGVAAAAATTHAGVAAPGVIGSGGEKTSPALTAYDDLLSGPLTAFMELSNGIGDVIKDQAQAVNQMFQAQRRIIEIASKSKKPSAEFTELLKPLQQCSLAVCEFRENNRQSPYFSHLSTVAEGVPALGWVAVEPKPSPFVGEMRDAAQFYANRVIKEFRDKDRKHVEWANSYISLLSDLQAYVKAHHTTGLTWNAKGAELKSVLAQPHDGGVANSGSGKGLAAVATPSQVAPTSSLFGELNRGGDITAHLKHVDKSQMTHKNPDLRAGSVVKADGVKPAAAPSPAKVAPKLPPRTVREANKWVVENHVNAQVTIDNVELKHVVYIYGCTGTTVQIKGKVNTVSIDNCKKTGVVVESTVAGVDLVNCKSAQLQILNWTPKVSVDKTDGCQIFMSAECVRQNMELFTAKSSEVNLSFPESDQPDSELAERAVPEQFKTVVIDGKLQTVCVEHKG